MIVDGQRIHWTQALDHADEIGRLLELAKVEKAKPLPSPLTPEGFDRWTALYTQRVMRAARTGDTSAVVAMVKALDQDWAKLSATKRDRLIKAAMSKINLRVADRFKISRVVASTMKEAVTATKKAAKGQLDAAISTSFDGIDKRIVDHVQDTQAHFIRDAYGVRREALSAKARGIVAKGLDAGFDSATIAAGLTEQMTLAGVLRAESYWENVSSIFMSRSRTWGQLRSFEEAGIEIMQWDSVLDELTTDVCDYMHGKLIEVATSMNSFKATAASEEPADVKDIQPFMRTGKNENGERILFFQSKGQTHLVATQTQQRSGTVDSRGSYTQHMGDKKLAEKGVNGPPIHGRCRSTLIPA